MKASKTKIILLVVTLIGMMILAPTIYGDLRDNMNSDVLDGLDGEIYYTKRVDGINTLFKSEAGLQNETLIYSHLGKGKDRNKDYNDNIIDFYYDSQSKIVDFVAMNDGSWSLFALKEGEGRPTLMPTTGTVKNTTSVLKKSDYLKKDRKQVSVFQKNGSLYLIENGEEKCVKKFHGFYDDKFTGYRPIGFSPNGEYLVYHSMEHLTLLGTIFEGAIRDSYGSTYILELSSGKSTRFLNASKIQWLTD